MRQVHLVVHRLQNIRKSAVNYKTDNSNQHKQDNRRDFKRIWRARLMSDSDQLASAQGSKQSDLDKSIDKLVDLLFFVDLVFDHLFWQKLQSLLHLNHVGLHKPLENDKNVRTIKEKPE